MESYKSIEKSPFIKLFFPFPVLCFPENMLQPKKPFTIKKKADNNIQGANFKVPFGGRFAQKLEKSFKNRIHWLNSPFSKDGVKAKTYWHGNYSFNLFSAPITLYYSMQRTNEPLKERNHSKWVKHFFYIYCAQYHGLKCNLCYAYIQV